MRFQVPAEPVHFVGVGGIGMSGIAKILLEDGCAVSGSDLASNRNTEELAQLGARIFQGHDERQVAEAGLVVVTSAAPESNPELRAARAQGVPIVKRAAFLGQLMAQRWGVAVAGTAGKTTTTAMIATILSAAGLDPTVACGGDLLELGSNARLGRGPHFVAEADEFDRSFLQLPARTKVITNIEADHLDLYGTMDALRQAFQQFAATPDSTVILNGDDVECQAIARQIGARAVPFLATSNPDLKLAIPGAHNRANAAAALATASALGVEEAVALQALATFRGTRRRLELVGEARGVRVIDDYAHHPTKVRASLQALRELTPTRLIVIFQPHLYARTKDHFDDFVRAFDAADEVIVVDTYSPAGREERREKTSADLAAAMHVTYVPSFADVAAHIDPPPGSIVVAMGAGTITELPRVLLERLRG
ncbi:MAG TPA: Mur ligase domain-containing protein [Chloroflexota bacterium]|nr:Mur ligase domain-containing protein [Chloroflexota bacterium]